MSLFAFQLNLHNIILFQFLIKRARGLINVLTTHIMETSRKFNRGICTEYDTIVRNITAQSETTDELVRQQDYVENLHVKELLHLRV